MKFDDLVFINTLHGLCGKVIDWRTPDQWDSVKNLEIIMHFEKEFGVRFMTQEIRAYRTPNELYEAICAKLYVKVLVLDCDGVLWDGIVGEDGVIGIRPRRQFQKQIVELESRGYLICLCSRNNEQDVWEVFDNVLMPLQRKHIVAAEIGWGSKADALQRLATTLNLSVGSFVFIDDNPMERDSIRAAGLSTRCVDPSDTAWPSWFTGQSTQGSLTEKYRSAAQFRADQPFLKSLAMTGRLAVNCPTTVDRCVELSQKTNQFNVRLMRYNRGDIERWMSHGAKVFCGKLVDRYGDHGIVGLAVIGESGTFFEFCVSCRALGRQFEFAFYRECAKLYPDPHISYVAGDRNQQCEAFVKQVMSGNYPEPPIEWL